MDLFLDWSNHLYTRASHNNQLNESGSKDTRNNEFGSCEWKEKRVGGSISSQEKKKKKNFFPFSAEKIEDSSSYCLLFLFMFYSWQCRGASRG